MILENVFGVEHVTYLIICAILFTISFYLINKIKDNEKIVKYIIKIIALKDNAAKNKKNVIEILKFVCGLGKYDNIL